MRTPCHCTNLRTLVRRVSAIYDNALEPFGLNINQFYLLRVVGEVQPVSLTDLGEKLELDRSTVGRKVRVLARTGLLVYARGDVDQREALVTLSGEGAELLSRAMPAWAKCHEWFERWAGAERIAVLDELLDLF